MWKWILGAVAAYWLYNKYDSGGGLFPVGSKFLHQDSGIVFTVIDSGPFEGEYLVQMDRVLPGSSVPTISAVSLQSAIASGAFVPVA